MVARAERRLAAILSADIVGYSRLVAADEAGTLARVRTLRTGILEPLVREHRGRVVQLAGDGILIEFASAVDAVECAVAIQAALAHDEAGRPAERRIRYRIGINIGDILVEDGDILGDGVNIAARVQALAEPGGISVTRNVWSQIKSKLDLEFESTGTHKVKNIAEPIAVWRVGGPGGRLRPGRTRRALLDNRLTVVAATLLLVAGGLAGAWLAVPETSPEVGSAADAAADQVPVLPLPDRPSIAVLPFDSMSSDSRHERLADGITEGIITDLSRFRHLFVIGRNSTFAYKGSPVDLRRIARELGVRYVLKGSLRVEGDRVRITAQLVDAADGSHVWAERHDRPVDEIFQVQDEVTERIAGSLAAGMGGVLVRSEREGARRKLPQSLEAYDYYLMGTERMHGYTEEDSRQAEELLLKAIELDPELARVHVSLAWTYNVAYDHGWLGPQPDVLSRWLRAARRAVALDPYDSDARMALGWYHQYTGNFARALAEIELALSLNPNNPDVLILAGGALSWLGKPELAVEVAERAVRVNPHFPDWYYGSLRDAYFHAGRFEDAVTASRRRQDISIWDLVYRPLAYAQLGWQEDLADAVADLLRNSPEYSAESFLAGHGTYAREAELGLFLESHRKADLPVCASASEIERNPEMKRLAQCDEERAGH